MYLKRTGIYVDAGSFLDLENFAFVHGIKENHILFFMDKSWGI